jgi:hypothetical protein
MFTYFYYSIVIISLILYFFNNILKVRLFHSVINFALILLFLSVSFRSNGVDYDGYYSDYIRYEKSIFDFIYSPLVDLFNYLSVPYSIFLFIQIGFFLLTLYKYCRLNTIDFTLVLLLYITHFFIIRDLSQSRIAFAFTFYLLYEMNTKRSYKLFYGIISIGIHFSIFPIFIIRQWINLLSNKWYRNYIHILTFIFLLLIGDLIIQKFYFLDPRIELYLNWKEPGYGDVLSNYFFIYFLCFILFINFLLSCFNYNKKHVLENNLIILFIYGIIIGISFSSFAIFSTRLTSIFATYYLFIVSKWSNLLFDTNSFKYYTYLPLILIIFFIFLILILRNDNLDIIKSIVF